jgi:anhydro-N-acetylmuramic acid kinase
VPTREIYLGLMSGTSLDGIDAVIADFASQSPQILANTHRGFEPGLRRALLELASPGADEIERAATLGNELSRRYAAAAHEVLVAAKIAPREVRAIGCHGQTVRHRPQRGYSVQIGNAALLAELSGIPVVADFRSRDIAAGGQGAPLVPAFHAAVFAQPTEDRAVVNLGGIANITRLPRQGAATGFDCGPGNCLLDLWASKHLDKPFDEAGAWGAGGQASATLLARLLADPFFAAPPPKSTGRELFNERWLASHVAAGEDPRAVQATLMELTAHTVADACRRHCPSLDRVLVCGGGTRNTALLRRLRDLMDPTPVEPTGQHGLDPMLVESTAFAWLAKQALDGVAAGLPAVTGARGPRVLGAIYPR